MKHLFLAVATLAVLAVPRLYAQKTDGDNLGEITFEELKDKDKSTQYFAVGGGFTGNFLMFDNAAVNSNLPAPFHVKDFSSPLFVTGGQGFVTFFFRNVRFGFNAAIGTQSVNAVDTVNGNSITRHVDFSSSFNGLTIDYAIPLTKGLTLLPGIQAGFGNIVFERYDGASSTNWTDIKADSSLHSASRLEVSQYFVEPRINLEWAITTFTMLRVNAGYTLSMHSDTWTLNRNTTVNGAPSALKAGGPTIGFGVFFGLFRNE